MRTRRAGIAVLTTAALLVLGAQLFGCASPPPYPVSDHYDGERFFNATPVQDLNVLQLAHHIAFGRNGDWPDGLVANDPAPRLDLGLANRQAAVTFVNHSTVLIQLAGINILTDPAWSDRVGPWSWAGPKRARPPGIPFDALPPIDVVLISHNHYDHLDLPTLRRLHERDRPRIFVPLGDRDLLLANGIDRVDELDWWQRVTLDGGLEIVFAPAQHNSGRSPFTVARSLWGSYLLRRDGLSIYFAGDTAYEVHFRAIRDRFGPVDLAFLPIGGYAPRERHRAFHLDPADAVQAQKDLGAKAAVAIHFGTFQLTGEDFGQPVADLRAVLSRTADLPGPFLVLPEGRTRLFAFPERAARQAAD